MNARQWTLVAVAALPFAIAGCTGGGSRDENAERGPTNGRVEGGSTGVDSAGAAGAPGTGAYGSTGASPEAAPGAR